MKPTLNQTSPANTNQTLTIKGVIMPTEFGLSDSSDHFHNNDVEQPYGDADVVELYPDSPSDGYGAEQLSEVDTTDLSGDGSSYDIIIDGEPASPDALITGPGSVTFFFGIEDGTGSLEITNTGAGTAQVFRHVGHMSIQLGGSEDDAEQGNATSQSDETPDNPPTRHQ
jgi:hypothetical protein